MRLLGETHFGVFDRALIESAMARPRQAAAYDGADLIHQAANLYYGLIKNHPWVGGNKRTATAIVDEFLYRNGAEIIATTKDVIDLVLAIESDRWEVDEIDSCCVSMSYRYNPEQFSSHSRSLLASTASNPYSPASCA